MIICEKYHFNETRAILLLMIAGIYLNDKHRDYNDVFLKAKSSLNLFIDFSLVEGRAEANFLLGMLSKKKIKHSGQPELIALKKQPKSELHFESEFDQIPNIQRSASGFRQVSEEGKNYLNVARQQFIELKHDYGLARVSLAMAMCELEESSYLIEYQSKLDLSEHDKLNISKNSFMDNLAPNPKVGNEIERLLMAAVKGFEKFRDYQNLIS